jgi:hypothetical protein
MDLIEAKRIAILFVNDEYPDCFGAILTGSTVLGTNSGSSDLDIIIFHKDVFSTTRSKRIIKDFEHVEKVDIDVFVVSMTNVIDLLSERLLNLDAPLPTMISQGIAIKDSDNTISELISYFKLQILKYYPVYSLADVSQIKGKTSQFIQLVEKQVDFEDCFFIVHEIVDKISKLYINKNKLIYGGIKKRSQILKNNLPHIYERIMRSLKTYYTHNDPTEFIETTKKILDDFYPTNPTSVHSGGELLIEIEYRKNISNIISIFREYSKGNLILTEKSYSIKYFYLRNDKFIIVLKTPVKSFDYKKVNVLMHNFLKLQPFENHLNIQAQKTPLFFGSANVLRLVETFLQEFHDRIVMEFLEDIHRQAHIKLSTTLAILIAEEFIGLTSLDLQEKRRIFNGMFEFWSAEVYDYPASRDLDYIIWKKRRLIQFLEKRIDNDSKNNILEIQAKLEKVKHDNPIVKRILEVIRQISPSFIYEYRRLKNEKIVEFPSYDLKVIGVNDEETALDLYLYKVVLDKLLFMICGSEMYLATYILKKQIQ